MVVRNVVRSPVRAVVQSVFGEGESFHPFQLFTSGAQGAWYDPSDFSTLYQDAAGTTPVTAVEQPVRLMLDRSRGLVLGSELVTNGDFSDGMTGWTQINGSGVVVGGVCTFTPSANFGSIRRAVTLVVGKSYQFTATVAGNSLARFYLGGTSGTALGTPGTTASTMLSVVGVATSTSGEITLDSGDSTTPFTITNISVRELPGNHATAPNDASRPVLRARYNLLTRSEEFDNAAWNKTDATITANDITAPNDTTTADRITATGANAFAQFVFSSIAGTTYTTSVFLKAGNISSADLRGVNQGVVAYMARFTLTGAGTATAIAGSPTVSILALGDGWYRCSMTKTHTAAAVNDLIQIVPGNQGATVVSDYVYAWGASLLTAADHAATGGAYQRVGAATDYDTGPPWRPYLAFDGSDDSMSTSSIDFSGTDKMTVFAGLAKLSDAARGIAVELGTDAAGTFLIDAPFGATTVYRFIARGSLFSGSCNTTNAVFKAPHTGVITGLGDISGDSQILRINGAQIAIDTSDLGTGNFVNASLFIGRRNNTSDPFNGRLYSLAVLGRTATAPELTLMESWIAGKTGVSL